MVCEDNISALPEDLLVTILSLVPIRDAVATMFLSKRWLSIWTMIHTLKYKDDDVDDDQYENEDLGDEQGEHESKKSVWLFLDKSMQLNKAHVIDSLSMKLGRRCPTNADVGKWAAYAVSRCVRVLNFKLRWSADPTSLPTSLYSSQYLVELTLSHKILVDVPSSASLPSLKSLDLYSVVYKDEDSLVSLLSSCPVLERLDVERNLDMDDNVTTFRVKVPSLLDLAYENFNGAGDTDRCLMIDTPALSRLIIYDFSGDSYSMDLPCLDTASICLPFFPDVKFLTSLSSVSSLTLFLKDNAVMCFTCSSIKFPWLRDCTIYPEDSDWMKPVMQLLQNSPKVESLTVDYKYSKQPDHFRRSWNEPHSIPECLSSQLQFFEWKGYVSIELDEQFLAYILANSMCLRTATIFFGSTIEPYLHEIVMESLEELPRVSTETQLIINTNT